MTDFDPRTTEGASNDGFSRRRFLQTAGAAGALAVGLGSGLAGSAAGGIAEFQDLRVGSDNRIVTESDETFVMRGLSIADPKRLEITKRLRCKSPTQVVDLLTDAENGWHPRVIRVPASPVDIGEHPNGNTGPEYGEDSPPEIANDRRKQRPPEPPAFERTDVVDYLERYYDPVVERCKERGVYCIVDYHRHWHEQPPGDGEGGDGPEGEFGAENHLPYDSEYTNYWAYNDYYGKEKPASWWYVDQKYRNEHGPESPSDLSGTPYDAWEVNQPLVEEATLFWSEAAKRYAGEPHVVFEPYDEPTAPGIWGPESGCGADKQKPLWNLFVDEFATPILDEIREYAPGKLLLMSVPGWCQGTQGLYWRDFDHDDVAVTYHVFGESEASQTENWLNDTEYEYREVTAPYMDQPPDPDEIWRESCYGWETYEARGLQDVQSIRPVAVTEFGWEHVESSRWGIPAEGATTAEFGKPFIDAVEGDDRISWVAGTADVRWQPRMFEADFPIPERVFELENGSWYETDESEYPEYCDPEHMPSDWRLLENPDMGVHVKERLAEHRTDQVPFELTDDSTGPGPSWPEGATDPDDDGDYEDLNGNERVDYNDVVQYFQNKDEPAITENVAYFDYNDNDRIDYNDVVELFLEAA